VAYAQLGVGAALARTQEWRAALAQQVAAVKLLRDTLEADEKNEVAHFDAAFALGQASVSDIGLGDLASAERRLKDAIGILERSSAVTAESMSDTRVLLGVNYYRLAQVNALGAAQAAGARQRNLKCQDARHWFELSQPTLAAAEGNAQWNWLTFGVPTQHPSVPPPCAGTIDYR
jgi:hypothetical protein